MIIGITAKSVQNIDGKSHLEFYVEENLGEREPREFWVDVIYDPKVMDVCDYRCKCSRSVSFSV